jgi:hypothetical protein
MLYATMHDFRNGFPFLIDAKYEQDIPRTYNVTLWRIRVTTVAVKKQHILNILSVGL